MSAFRSRARDRARAAGALAAVVLAASALAAGADGKNPGLSGYTEPAPRPVQEKHALDVVQHVLRRERSKAHVSQASLRRGITVGSAPVAAPTSTAESSQPKPPAATPRHRRKPRVAGRQDRPRTIAIDLAPARRAGVDTPVDQHRSTIVPWLAVAAALAAVGTLVELARIRA